MRYEINANELARAVKENHGSFAAASRATGVSSPYISQLYWGDRKPDEIKEGTYRKLLKGLTPEQIKKLEKQETAATIAEHEKLAMWIEGTQPEIKSALLGICKVLGYDAPPKPKKRIK